MRTDLGHDPETSGPWSIAPTTDRRLRPFERGSRSIRWNRGPFGPLLRGLKILAVAVPLFFLASCDPKVEPMGGMAMPRAVSRDRAKDPVCGMMADRATSPNSAHETLTYYFCSDECLSKFKASPGKYVK